MNWNCLTSLFSLEPFWGAGERDFRRTALTQTSHAGKMLRRRQMKPFESSSALAHENVSTVGCSLCPPLQLHLCMLLSVIAAPSPQVLLT